jgi:hypothetical protein
MEENLPNFSYLYTRVITSYIDSIQNICDLKLVINQINIGVIFSEIEYHTSFSRVDDDAELIASDRLVDPLLER